VKIRNKLTLYFSLASACIVLAFGVSVYFFSAQYRQNEFFQRLKIRVGIAEKVLLEKETFSEADYAKIREQFLNSLPDETEEVVKLSSGWQQNLSYKYPAPFLESLSQREEVFFRNDTIQGAGRVFPFRNDNYAVIITAVDKVGIRVLRNLQTIIMLGILACITVISILSYYISNRLIHPISIKIRKANTISGTNFHDRLVVYNPDDELGEMAIAFNRLLDRLEGAFNMQKLFVANASHEIRNPLTAILGEAEVALGKERSVQDYKESLKSISLEADRLNLLVNNLLQLSTISDGDVVIKRETIWVEDLLDDARKKFDLLTPNNQLRIEFGKEFRNREPFIYGNKNLLVTALINIFDNASKFSSDGIVDLHVNIKDNTVVLSVKDSGVGIPPDDIPKITQPFFRAENVRQIRGTGIGIPLTLRIIEIHNGKLDVKSELNKGTIVTIVLPTVT
jgi:signal transduction histidine kinase